MSSTTLVTLDKPIEREEPLSSGTPTPVRNSFEHVPDEEKLSVHEQDEAHDPEPLSKVRLILLMLGLCLSIFLVALDFVR
jgi:hypothetical protein